MSFTRINAYRIMWTLVMYDLPTETKKERRIAAQFRKRLIEDGFSMFQFSMYLRHSQSSENATVHKRRVINILPENGKVGILQITDRQFDKWNFFLVKKKLKNQTFLSNLNFFRIKKPRFNSVF